MPRKPWRRASSVRRRVSSSFQAVPYRKRGTRTPPINKVRSGHGLEVPPAASPQAQPGRPVRRPWVVPSGASRSSPGGGLSSGDHPLERRTISALGWTPTSRSTSRPALEHQQGRDAAGLEAGGGSGVLVHVQLREPHPPGQLRGQLVDHRGEHPARPAPRPPTGPAPPATASARPRRERRIGHGHRPECRWAPVSCTARTPASPRLDLLQGDPVGHAAGAAAETARETPWLLHHVRGVHADHSKRIGQTDCC